MTNLNQELIEKVRQGKAAIHNDQNKENKEKLRTLLSVIFPEDNPEMCYSNMEYYYASTDLKIWTCADDLPRGLEAIPLSAFFTNELPKEDLNLIAQIDARLKHYNLIALVDTKEEVEYVRCVKSVLVFTEGHIYKLSSVSANNIKPFVMYNGRQHCGYDQYRMFFFPATEAEYLSQQGEQPNQIKEEVKERYKPKMFDIYFYITEKFIVYSTKYSHPSLDDPRINAGNCFKTEEEAQSAADKIKAILETI